VSIDLTEPKKGRGFVEIMDDLELSEPSVHCGSCQVDKPLKREQRSRPHKCCSYFPFWSAYQAGAFLEDGGIWPFVTESLSKPGHEKTTEISVKSAVAEVGQPNRSLSDSLVSVPVRDVVFLPVGVVPGPAFRRLQESLSWESRGEHPKMVCSYYQKSRGECGIFKFRPPECRRYYCASSRPGGYEYRQRVFTWSQSILDEGLKKTILQLGYTGEDWGLWQKYLETPGWDRPVHKAIVDPVVAARFYKKVYENWPSSLGRELVVPPFSMLLGKNGKSYCRTRATF